MSSVTILLAIGLSNFLVEVEEIPPAVKEADAARSRFRSLKDAGQLG